MEWISDFVQGLAKSWMAAILQSMGLTCPLPTTWPRKEYVVTTQVHFDGLTVKPKSLKCLSMIWRW